MLPVVDMVVLVAVRVANGAARVLPELVVDILVVLVVPVEEQAVAVVLIIMEPVQRIPVVQGLAMDWFTYHFLVQLLSSQ